MEIIMKNQKFEVGDIICGVQGNGFRVTNEKMYKAEVCDLLNVNKMKIKVVNHMDKNENGLYYIVLNEQGKFRLIENKDSHSEESKEKNNIKKSKKEVLKKIEDDFGTIIAFGFAIGNESKYRERYEINNNEKDLSKADWYKGKSEDLVQRLDYDKYVDILRENNFFEKE